MPLPRMLSMNIQAKCIRIGFFMLVECVEYFHSKLYTQQSDSFEQIPRQIRIFELFLLIPGLSVVSIVRMGFKPNRDNGWIRSDHVNRSRISLVYSLNKWPFWCTFYRFEATIILNGISECCACKYAKFNHYFVKHCNWIPHRQR